MNYLNIYIEYIWFYTLYRYYLDNGFYLISN